MSAALIRFSLPGDHKKHKRIWRVGADRLKDNEETLRAHLKRWMPTAEWEGYSWADKRKK